jgi:hypothetical protein
MRSLSRFPWPEFPPLSPFSLATIFGRRQRNFPKILAWLICVHRERRTQTRLESPLPVCDGEGHFG